MTRLDRLATQLLQVQKSRVISSRVATSRLAVSPFDEGDHTDVEEGWTKHPDDHEGHHSLFDHDHDDLDLEDEEHHHHGSPETLRKIRLKLLAGMTWASLGEPDAVVAEVSPNELSVKVQDLSWKITLDDEGRVTISGFDSGSEQFVGKLPETDAEHAIVKISDNIHQLISDDIDDRSEPPDEPVHFGPEETPGETGPEPGEPPPVAPEGDQGVSPEEMAPPPDMGAGPPMDQGAGMPPAGPGMGAPPPQPGMPPPPQQQPYPPPYPPMASRTTLTFSHRLNPRVASAQMETVANRLRVLGESMGEDGDEVFASLADRIDRVTNQMNQVAD